MVDFIMNTTGNNYSYWYPEQKTNGYQQDMAGSGRQQSAACELSLAMVRDNQQIYEQRSLPTIEYFTSRNSSTIVLDGSTPYMDGPTGTVEDWCALSLLSGKRCYIFQKIATDFAGSLLSRINPSTTYTRTQALDNAKNYLRSLIAMYRMTGIAEYLDDAKKAADDYIYWRINREPIDFYDMDSSFWIEIGPIWDALEQIYNETGRTDYLNATIAAIKQRTAFNYLTPPIPNTNVTVDGETVPAWRVSSTGLNAECGGTAHSHRGIFMMPEAGPMLRMAYRSGDTLLRDIARAAVVGRYANYPGYTYRDRLRLEFTRPDYPLRWFEDYVNTAHYNHPLPMCLYTIDFLVSDFLARSAGAISFPCRYSSTGAYFRNQIYGDRPGSFYGDSGVWLWLPKALVTTNNIQLNYIAGYGNGKLYLAFANQSKSPVTTTVTLNNSLIPYGTSHSAAVWQQNVPAGTTTVVNGQVTVNVAADGITALAIDGINIRPFFQSKYTYASSYTLPSQSYQSTTTSYGKVTGSIISFSRSLTSSHVWLGADTSQLQRATLHYSTGAAWQQITDSTYPFEFTIPLDASVPNFTFYIEGLKVGGATENSSTLTLPVFTVPHWTVGSIAFPDVVAGAPVGEANDVLIENDTPGNLVFTGSGLEITGDDANNFSYQISSTNPIPSGQTRTVSVTFRPLMRGSKNAQLKIYTNYPDRPVTTIDLSGKGLSPGGTSVIYVSPTGNDANTGESWGEALATISAAIETLPSEGGNIWVKKGTYNLTETITVSNFAKLYGGFTGTESSLTERDISKIFTDNAATLNMTANAKRVMNIDTVNNVCVDGFILKGAANVSGGGAGLRLSQSSGSVVVQNCQITGNSDSSADGAGAGVRMVSSNVAFINCEITNNLSQSTIGGGGMYFDSTSTAVLTDLAISGNKTNANNGGGIYINASATPVRFENCRISNNSSALCGGGIYAVGSLTLKDCILTDNLVRAATAESYGGGGIYLNSGSANVNIDNCVFSGNYVNAASSGRGGGGAMQFKNWSTISVTNSLFTGNRVSGETQTRGGAIYFREGTSTVTIRNCTLDDNYVGNDGGGINVRSGNVNLINTILTNNDKQAFHVWFDGTSTESANLYYNNGTDGTPVADPLYVCRSVSAVTGTWSSVASFVPNALTGLGTTVLTANGTPFTGLQFIGMLINPDITQKRQALILSNTNNTVTVEGNGAADYGVSAGDSFRVIDNHECSVAGRFNFVAGLWQTDTVHSSAIDTGDANYTWVGELWPHGKHINKGAYGGTPQASMSTSSVGNKADFNNDDDVDYIDLARLADKWLIEEILLAEDLNRDGKVDFLDFAIFVEDWQ